MAAGAAKARLGRATADSWRRELVLDARGCCQLLRVVLSWRMLFTIIVEVVDG